jgi:beta-1,4-mannosyl-glycoprotein beta-1,4-N-acetylglucosaminyltransferase
MKIVDCFMFHDELDMLFYRLSVLEDVVDTFVLVESEFTFSGEPKNLIFEENQSRFAKWRHKIVHVGVGTCPFFQPHIRFDRKDQWKNEEFQRNALKRGIDSLSLTSDDLILINDVDEIPDPKTLRRLLKKEIDVQSALSLQQDFYYYKLENQVQMKWILPKIVSVGFFRSQGWTCHEYRWKPFPILPQGGWHLSYFGDKTSIQRKIHHFSHQEYNQEKYTDLNHIQICIDQHIDLFDRPEQIIRHISLQDNDYLPPLIDLIPLSN